MALRDLDPEEHLRDPARKQRYVTTLFDTIAPKYDRFARLFSFGMDRRWKQQLAAWVADVVQPGDVVVDLACGTGDVASAIDRLTEGSVDRGIGGSRDRKWEGLGPFVVGLDPSAEMLRVARERGASPRTLDPSIARSLDRSITRSLDPTIHRPAALLRADIQSLPLAPASVAAVTVGYGFRNVPDVGVALAEVARVVRPGGWLFDLDFFRPDRPVWRRLYLWYLRSAGRALGRWWHGDPEAYGYIARSLEHWVTPPEFEALLERSRFRVDRVVRHLGGGICLHRAQRLGGGAATS